MVDCQHVDSFNHSLCKIPCDTTLDCGHKCQSTCHHGKHPSCSEEVQFVIKSCGHEVTKKCSEDEKALKCQQEITFKFPECLHIKLCKCWMKEKGLQCNKICGRLRNCGHQCTLKCFQKCEQNECGDCQEIAKVQAAKEKQQAILQMKMKKQELKEEIKRLKMQERTRLIIKELSEEGDTAAEYLQGCYFATDSTKSAQQMYTNGSNKLLLCEVNLGNTWTVQKPCKYMDLEKIRKKGYDPLFSKRNGNATGGTLYDEFVIYNVKQAIVRYIVHYISVGLDSEALNPRTMQLQKQNLVRIPYELSASFKGYNDSEFHFRLAESQFFRMSTRTEHKVVKVELILNIALTKSYEKAKQKFIEESKLVEEMFVFHGTDKNAIDKIVEEGFKIGGDGIPVRNGRVYGSGVYTASDPCISIRYAKGLNMLLLSLALIGKGGTDYKKGGSQDVFVLDKTEYLLPKYIVHFERK